MSVFVVDDEPLMLDIVHAALEGEFEVELFASAEACRQRLAEKIPDVLLLDVMLGGLDGYTFCRQLKDDFDTQDIPVLFISAAEDVETSLLCYDAGGYDFLSKPILPAELQRKMRVLGQQLASRKALSEQAGYAQRTAMSAMVSMGELGVVLQFLSRSFACVTAEEVAHAVVAAMQQYDLKCVVQVRVGDEVISLNGDGPSAPMEISVLNHVRDAGRIFQFKSRCVFNYGRITLMVNNMPVEDSERCGRIRDNGALLAEGADARLHGIEMEVLAARRREGIESMMPKVQATLDAVQGNYRRNCFELTEIMVEFQETLMKSFVHLGLSDTQEEHLTAMAGAFMQRMVGSQDESLCIVGQLESLAETLEDLLKH